MRSDIAIFMSMTMLVVVVIFALWGMATDTQPPEWLLFACFMVVITVLVIMIFELILIEESE